MLDNKVRKQQLEQHHNLVSDIGSMKRCNSLSNKIDAPNAIAGILYAATAYDFLDHIFALYKTGGSDPI
jgi:hypothetical protein